MNEIFYICVFFVLNGTFCIFSLYLIELEETNYIKKQVCFRGKCVIFHTECTFSKLV